MDNEIVAEKSWWKRNWKWFVPISGIFMICIVFVSGIDGSLTDYAQAYTDASLCQTAIDTANKNERVIDVLGHLEPIDKLAILEGNARYSNNNHMVNLTVRVTGNKGKAKMDVAAEKHGENWTYKNIKLRIKDTGEEIPVVE
jgi:hypothetical protein